VEVEYKDNLPLPTWHEDVLNKRAKQYHLGNEQSIPWSEAKESIMRATTEHSLKGLKNE